MTPVIGVNANDLPAGVRGTWCHASQRHARADAENTGRATTFAGGTTLARVLVLKVLFWCSLGALVWTHVLYPLAAMALARVRQRRVRRGADSSRRSTVVVAAHDEEAVIARRLENLLALDYPAESSRSSSPPTPRPTRPTSSSAAAREPRVRLLRCPRGGKVAAQDIAVRETEGEIVAFTDANATWAPDALRLLVRASPTPTWPTSAAGCGSSGRRLEPGRRLLALRAGAPRRRVAARLGHRRQRLDLRGAPHGLRRGRPALGARPLAPYLMVQRGRRAVYDREAQAFEKPTPTNETEYRRKVRMFEHCWLIMLRGRMLRRLPPLYGSSSCRTGSSATAAASSTSSCSRPRFALAAEGGVYAYVLGAQFLLFGRRSPASATARYYVLDHVGDGGGARNYLRRGVPATWEAAEGTR